MHELVTCRRCITRHRRAFFLSGTDLLIDAAGPKPCKLYRSNSERTIPEALHKKADLAPPSVGRYQMKRDLQPADVTLHDAQLLSFPSSPNRQLRPLHNNDDGCQLRLSDAASRKLSHTNFI